MRTITINFNASTVVGSFNLGKRGEHNAVKLQFTPPTELSSDTRTNHYRVAFNTGGKTIISEEYTTIPFEVSLGSQLTKHSRLSLQVIAYASDGAYIGKSDKLSSFYFEGAIEGSEVEIDGNNSDIAYEVAQNTADRHTHSNKAILDTVAETATGIAVSNHTFWDVAATESAIASAVVSAEGDLVEIVRSGDTSRFTASELVSFGSASKGFSYNGTPVISWKAASSNFYFKYVAIDNSRNAYIRTLYVDASKTIRAYQADEYPVISVNTKTGTGITLDASDIVAPSGWTPPANNSLATKKYVDDHASSSDWADITNKPSTFPPSAHTHTVSQITDYSPYDDTAIKGRVEVIEGKEAGWDAKQNAITSTNKLDYSLIANTPSIPTVPSNVSAFTNDSGYLTEHQSLADYPTTTTVEQMIAEAVGNALSASYGG